MVSLGWCARKKDLRLLAMIFFPQHTKQSIAWWKYSTYLVNLLSVWRLPTEKNPIMMKSKKNSSQGLKYNRSWEKKGFRPLMQACQELEAFSLSRILFYNEMIDFVLSMIVQFLLRQTFLLYVCQRSADNTFVVWMKVG